MPNQRLNAFNNISRLLAITRFDIEHRQSINDLSLNVHGENYFRDVFNFVYGLQLENDNFNTKNSSCIDLIDKTNKIAYQITTTRTTEKMHNTFLAFKEDKFKNYDIRILYLLEKAKPNTNTQKEFNAKYDIDLKSCLFDSEDLIRAINNLDTVKLIELNEKHFKNLREKYTDKIVLDLVCRKLVANVKNMEKDYDDDWGSLYVDKKLQLNSIKPRIANQINSGLDFISTLYLDDDSAMLTNLRAFVIDELYVQTLLELLSTKVSMSIAELKCKNVHELHELATNFQLDFNKVISNLYDKLHSEIDITDFNSMNISWTIIAYFFEICDVGIKE